ncbi:MAG: 4Fe-4S dicluster domain-containing protein, partial [Raoultibacter sp.]
VGFACIVHANPFNLAESIAAAQEAIDFAGPSAILYEAPCVSLVKPGAPAIIDTQACTGCKKCITEIGCPAIGFAAESKRAFIDATLCNGCGLCTQVCPFSVIALPADGGVCGVQAAAENPVVIADKEASHA